MTVGQEREEYEQVLDTVVTSVSETYYSQLVQAVSVARGRAQAAQSTVTLFAGGLMAALSVTALADRPAPIRWTGIASVALWLLAALLYLHAVASPVPEDPEQERKVASRRQLLDKVIAKVREEARTIDRWQRRANRAAAVAVALSVLTFAATVLTDPVRETAEGAVVIDPSYASALSALCSKESAAAGRVEGRIVKDSLRTSFVEIEPDRGVCEERGTTLHLPRGKVRGVRWQDG
ncbi:hypothetical protein CW362_08215 [Streptomyces populi]|uniref:Uncharacterized protein n=1 Tax=Streptomyces populi TaxID=2058924 RepID=A0A2I0SUG6_9ACTN|nr:hypothetical protein [Streptomyces populi]PKT73533.1 hypothetical protein CW362_08215 [Streptomyces populi]